MPKIMIGGVVREMTPEEEARFAQEMASIPKPEPTPEERIAILESALLELGAMLGGV